MKELPGQVVLGDMFEHMQLMSLCKHSVIANSSFSWWAAWLSRRNGLRVAPKRWFSNQSLDTKDIVPDWWTKIQVRDDDSGWLGVRADKPFRRSCPQG